jgi:hypothetical protein
MMVVEEIIRSSPRQQAPPCIAEGFSPTARGVYGLNAQSSLAQQQALLWGIGYWLFLCPASSAPIGYRLSAIPLPGVQRSYRLSAIGYRLFLCPASSAPIGYRLSAIPLPGVQRSYRLSAIGYSSARRHAAHTGLYSQSSLLPGRLLATQEFTPTYNI